MKRLLCLILIMSVILSLIIMPQPVYSADLGNFIKELTVLTDIGIADKEFQKKNAEDKVTRGEYAKLICDLINLTSQGSAFEVKFTDVPATDKHFASIMTLEGLGYINGYSETEFMPEREITLTEAMKIIVRVMGYTYLANANGGYPTGYQYTANNLGLLKGIKSNHNLNAVFSDVVKLIYNSLDIDIAKATGITGDGDKIYTVLKGQNILTEYHKMQKIKGIVTANRLTGIKNYSPTTDNKISVNGVLYEVKDNSNISLLGSEVELIYSTNEEENYKIISITERDLSDTSFVLDIEDICGEKDNTILYEDENGNIESITFDKGADIIYNGEKKSIPENFFTSLSQGTVKFLKTTGGSYDVVIINDYKTMVVERINENTRVLTDMYSITNDTLDLNENKFVVIKNDKGKDINFDFISIGDVITYADNTNNAFLYVGGNVISGNISEISYDGNRKVLTIGEASYKLNKEANERYSSVNVGDYVKAYLDAFGNIAYVTAVSKDGYEYLYMVKAVERPDGPETKIIARFFEKTKGVCDYTFANDVIVNGTKKKNLTFDTLKQELNNETSQLLQVKLNEDGLIKEINVPKDLKYLEDNNTDGFCKTHKLMSRTYWHDPPTFARSILINKNTTEILVVPKDPDTADEDDYYTITTNSLVEGEDYYMEAYSLTKDYQIPDFIVIKTSKGGSSAPAFVYETPVYVLKSIKTVLGEDDMPVTKYTVQKGTEETFFYIDKDNMPVSKVTYNGDISETAFTPDMLSVGDIFRFTKDGKGFIRRFEMYYDYDHPDSWFYTADVKKYGAVMTEVVRYSGDYVFVPHWWLQQEGELYGGFGMNETFVSGRITVIEPTGSIPKVRAGTAQDIEKGDKVVIHLAYAQLHGLIVFK